MTTTKSRRYIKEEIGSCKKNLLEIEYNRTWGKLNSEGDNITKTTRKEKDKRK